jgi:hypothetical protein
VVVFSVCADSSFYVQNLSFSSLRQHSFHYACNMVSSKCLDQAENQVFLRCRLFEAEAHVINTKNSLLPHSELSTFRCKDQLLNAVKESSRC